jgi:serine/threonine protein kinase
MGVVYEGRDPNLDRRVAIKTVKVENLSEEAAAEYEHRFRTEARSAARLQHPNIVSVYDSDRSEDVAFLVMEYIQGDDLKHHLDRGVRYSLEQSLKIIRDLLSALDYAHKQGIVHRDIKPANLLIEPGGRVKLTDFGVARIQDSGEATRTQGSMVGTLKYMAPEQVQGQKIDSRADLFSVGVVLYQLLTDKRPFDGDNDFSIIHQIIGHHPPAPSSINPRLPAVLDAVVARALAKERDERFATARDFAVALQAAIRRAEDQTVVPPMNPNKKVEPIVSRPLTVPGSVPGNLTNPSAGTLSSVTQELELVYWKDVKDATDPEDLQGFLERFPAGIYADLARRRLRKLAGGEPTVMGGASQPGTGTSTSVFAATQFPPTLQPQDQEATRLRTDASRPFVSGDASDLRPAKWVEQEYTRTVVQTTGTVPGTPGATVTSTLPIPPVAAAPVPIPAAPVPIGAAPAPAVAPAPAAAAASVGVEAVKPVAPPARSRVIDDDDDSLPPAPAKKKLPLAVLAGIGALAVAGVLALVMGRSSTPPVDPSTKIAAIAPATTTKATMPVVAPTDAPVTVPPPLNPAVVAAAASVPPPLPPEQSRAAAVQAPKKGASQPRSTQTAAAVKVAPEPARNGFITPVPPPRIDPEPAPQPRAPTQTVASNNGGNYQAVDQCKDKMFLSRELCLAEQCDKPGTRNHPLCIKRREEVRMREEGKVRQGPQ